MKYIKSDKLIYTQNTCTPQFQTSQFQLQSQDDPKHIKIPNILAYIYIHMEMS